MLATSFVGYSLDFWQLGAGFTNFFEGLRPLNPLGVAPLNPSLGIKMSGKSGETVTDLARI